MDEIKEETKSGIYKTQVDLSLYLVSYYLQALADSIEIDNDPELLEKFSALYMLVEKRFQSIYQGKKFNEYVIVESFFDGGQKSE